MKLLKKLLSYIIAVTMVLSLATLLGGNVHAAEGDGTTGTAGNSNTPTTYTLTLSNTGETKHNLEVYQIFTGDLSGDILSNIKWGTGVSEDGKKALGDAAAKAKALSDATDQQAAAKTFAEDLQNHLQSPVASEEVDAATKNANGEKVPGTKSITISAAGYYLVKDQAKSQNGVKSGATTSYILKVVKDVTATTKLDVPTVEKKVKDTNDSTGITSGWQDSADYDIGDEVPYQITGTMPSNIDKYTQYKYVFTDTMSKGLTYTAKTAKIMIGTTDVTSKFGENVTENADGTTVLTWTCDDLTKAGVALTPTTKVVVTYTAELNENAVHGSAGNPNTVNLTYSNNPNKGGEGETGKTPDDKNIVFTYKAVVNKVDQEQKTLAGAAFKLEKKNNQGVYNLVKSFTAGNDTTFEFKGLDDGDYKLTETTTPAGYNTITPIEFTISADHDTTADEPALTRLSVTVTKGEATFKPDKDAGSLTTNVVNKKGSTLPETGGMGTTLLYVAGGILVACAAAYVVLNKKRA